MIRLIQRRLIIPRGDTGTFTVPVLKTTIPNSVAVFFIFDLTTQKRIFSKIANISDDTITIEFSHADTINLPAGSYVWDIKFYQEPIYLNEEIIGGNEIDSYYAAFKLPVCEIRETGDNFILNENKPIPINQLNILTTAISLLQNSAIIPAAPTNDGEYFLKALVVNGNVNYEWAEVINNES